MLSALKMLYALLTLRAPDRDLWVALETARRAAERTIGKAVKVMVVSRDKLNQGELLMVVGCGGGAAQERTALALHPLVAIHELGHIANQHSDKRQDMIYGNEGVDIEEIRIQEEEANQWADRFIPWSWKAEWLHVRNLNQKHHSNQRKTGFEAGSKMWKRARAIHIIRGRRVAELVGIRERILITPIVQKALRDLLSDALSIVEANERHMNPDHNPYIPVLEVEKD